MSQLSTIEDQILCTLLYYRTYNSQEFLGFLFDLHESNVCRLLWFGIVVVIGFLLTSNTLSVIPAKAGIQLFRAVTLDPRLRGDDTEYDAMSKDKNQLLWQSDEF